MLSRGHNDVKDYGQLIRRNISLMSQIEKSSHNIDLVIFHEGNINSTHQDYIKKQSANQYIKFISVENEFITKPIPIRNKYCYETNLSKSFSFGYKSMCKFWFNGFMAYVNDYDYLIRVDDDCMIRSLPIDYLILQMKNHNFSYITPKIYGKDDEDVTIGLAELCNDFIRKHKLKLDVLDLNNNPYTNVFVLALDNIRSNYLFEQFACFVNETDSIFINRWGDLPLWGAFLSIDHDHFTVSIDSSIKYIHGSHYAWINCGNFLEKNVYSFFVKGSGRLKVFLKRFCLVVRNF